MPSISTYVDVEFELHNIDVDDLIDELESRGFTVMDKDDKLKQNVIPLFYDKTGKPMGDLLELLYYAYTTKKHDVTDELLKQLFYETLGRIA
jgi:predicted glycosyltransferase